MPNSMKHVIMDSLGYADLFQYFSFIFNKHTLSLWWCYAYGNLFRVEVPIMDWSNWALTPTAAKMFRKISNYQWLFDYFNIKNLFREKLTTTKNYDTDHSIPMYKHKNSVANILLRRITKLKDCYERLNDNKLS